MKVVKQFRHYGNGEIYSYVGTAKVMTREQAMQTMQMFKVFHTEDERYVAIFIDYKGDLIADYHHDLAIYVDDQGNRWGRPDEMFFGNVKLEDGTWIKRFTEVNENGQDIQL